MKHTVHTTLPAGAGERMQYFSLQFNDCTVRFLLRYPGLLDPDCLRQATRAVIDSTDILHASFLAGNIKSHWQIHREYEDSSCFRYVETDADPMDTALSFALQPVSPKGTAQLRCCLVQNRECSAVSVNISTLCVDGGDGKYLLMKLAEAYSRILFTGSSEGLPIKNGSRTVEQVYRNLPLRDFLSLLKSPFTGVKSTIPLPSSDDGIPRVVTHTISVQTMAAARRRYPQPPTICFWRPVITPAGHRRIRAHEHRLHDGPAAPLRKRRIPGTCQHVRHADNSAA